MVDLSYNPPEVTKRSGVHRLRYDSVSGLNIPTAARPDWAPRRNDKRPWRRSVLLYSLAYWMSLLPPMTYDAFLDAVHERLFTDDREATAQVATVVLKTFSEILYRTERDKLSAPLPKELTRPLQAARPETSRQETERLTAEAFLDRIQARADLNRDEAQAATRVVLDVFREATDEPVLSEIGDHLPHSYADLFPFMDRPASSGSSPA